VGSKFIKAKGPSYTTSYKRPFNNKKRTRGRDQQVKAERAWGEINEQFKQYLEKREIEDEGEDIHNAKED